MGHPGRMVSMLPHGLTLTDSVCFTAAGQGAGVDIRNVRHPLGQIRYL